MKNIIIGIFVLLTIVSQAFAEEQIREVPRQNQESIQSQVQEMTQAGISEIMAKKMLTQMVQKKLDQQTQYQIRKMVMAAAQEGLPSEPLMNKAMEGMAKKVDGPHIVAAVKTVQLRYRYSYQAAKSLSFDEKTTKTITRTMADSIAAGMQKEDMDLIMDQLRRRIQNLHQERYQEDQNLLATRTMQTIRTMARERNASSDVSFKVCKALINGYTSREIANMSMQEKSSSRKNFSTNGFGNSQSISGGSPGKILSTDSNNRSGGSNSRQGRK